MRELPGAFETASSVLFAMQSNNLLGRADDHFARLPAKIRKLEIADLDAAARRAIDPAKLLWVVVGDAEKVRPQLEELGLPVETVTAR